MLLLEYKKQAIGVLMKKYNGLAMSAFVKCMNRTYLYPGGSLQCGCNVDNEQISKWRKGEPTEIPIEPFLMIAELFPVGNYKGSYVDFFEKWLEYYSEMLLEEYDKEIISVLKKIKHKGQKEIFWAKRFRLILNFEFWIRNSGALRAST